jgi:hypothetical protein
MANRNRSSPYQKNTSGYWLYLNIQAAFNSRLRRPASQRLSFANVHVFTTERASTQPRRAWDTP